MDTGQNAEPSVVCVDTSPWPIGRYHHLQNVGFAQLGRDSLGRRSGNSRPVAKPGGAEDRELEGPVEQAEFEFATRGDLEGKTYARGDVLVPGGKHVANLSLGILPHQDRTPDGHGSHGPVSQFAHNEYGTTGKVWELVRDWYDPGYVGRAPTENPQGPATGTEGGERGGSWLVQRKQLPALRRRGPDDDRARFRAEQSRLPLRVERRAGRPCRL